jgi:hypothetical protein
MSKMENEGIRIACGNIESLQERTLIAGVRPVTPEEVETYRYQAGAFVPDDPREPTIEELESFLATPDTNPRLVVEFFTLPDGLIERAQTVYQQNRGDFHNKGDNHVFEILPGVYGTLFDIVGSDPNVPTTIVIDPKIEGNKEHIPGERPGLHFDKYDPPPLVTRRQRVVGHFGGDPRRGVIVMSTNILQIAEEQHPGDPTFVPRTSDAREYMRRHPDQTVLLVQFSRGQAYKLPYQHALHEGSTTGQGASITGVFDESRTRRWKPDSFRSASLLH